MRLSDKLRGIASVELRAAYPERLINACAAAGIELRKVTRTDACTLRADILEKDWETLRNLTESQMGEAELLRRRGGSRGRAWIGRRAVLLASLLGAGFVLLLSELHIWEIDVRGCETLTRGQVLRALEDCGVSIGSYWPGLSSDSVRSKMLLRLPELAWMTVNVNGSRAVVYVVERSEKPEIYIESEAADVVASETGVLRELTVLNGRPLVTPGNSVVKGEILVAGAVDSLSHPTRFVRAEARAMADTWYEWTAVAPSGVKKEGAQKKKTGALAIRFGKKRVNLYKGSRKALDGYDKIIREYKLGVPGLFAFPVSLIREEYTGGTDGADTAPSPGERLRCALEERVEGELLEARVSTVPRDGWTYTTLRAHCLENIAETAELSPP